jgi:hypothetical protein
MNKHHPYHPIVYVRGSAATQGEIEEAVADPYMGFNVGSTKARQVWTGELKKFFFESPIVRLLREHDYDDAFVAGKDLIAAMPRDPAEPQRLDITLPYQSIIIYRYYDEASEAFGTGNVPPIERFAEGLSLKIGSDGARSAVDKFFSIRAWDKARVGAQPGRRAKALDAINLSSDNSRKDCPHARHAGDERGIGIGDICRFDAGFLHPDLRNEQFQQRKIFVEQALILGAGSAATS